MNILNLIWKRKTVVIISTLLACLLGFIFSLIIRPTYKATVEIAMQPTDVVYGFSKDAAAISEYLRQQVEIIKSNEVVDNAIDKLHLRITDVLSQRKPRESFLKHIEVKPIGSTLIRITAVAKTPQLAAGMASQLSSSFLELHKERGFFISQDAMRWLTESSNIAKELKGAENNLLNFIKENDMQNPQQQLSLYQERTEQLISEKSQLLVELEENEKIIEKLQKLTEGKDATEIITQYLDPPLKDLLGRYETEYKAIQSEIGQLLATYKPDHPKIVELNQRKESIIKDVDSKIKDLLKESENEADNARSKISKIEAEIEKDEGKYSNLLDKKREYDILKIKLENLTKLYEEAQRQIESGGISIISVSIVGFAREGSVPVIKTRPIKMFLIIFTLAGFLIGILMVFFLERTSIEKKVPPESPESTESTQM